MRATALLVLTLLLAAPVVVPPAVVIAPGLLVYALAEWVVSFVWPTRSEEMVLRAPSS